MMNPDVVTWQRPFEGFVKLNVDAAFHEDQGSGATAAVIRTRQVTSLRVLATSFHMWLMQIWWKP
jgi:hypothetical protein